MSVLATQEGETSSTEVLDYYDYSHFPEGSDYYGYSNFSDAPTEYDVDSFQCSNDGVRRLSKVLLPTLYSFICFFGLLGNIFVVITFVFYKKSQSMTDTYLLNMAIADILFVVTLPFWIVYRADSWIFGNFMCKLVQSVYAINFYCGMLLLASISIDRYIAIVQATRCFRFRAITLTHKRLICFLVWAFSALFSSVTYIFNEAYEHKNTNGTKFVCEPRYNKNFAVALKLLKLSVQLSLGFFLPIMIMLFCYAFIVRTLLKARNSKKHKAIRIIIAVLVVFLVCQIPYNSVLLLHAFDLSDDICTYRKRLAYAMVITEALSFFHCCLNPVLYAFVGVKFRNYLLKTMHDLWCLSSKFIRGARRSRIYSDEATYSSRKTSEAYDDKQMSSFTM